MTENNHFDDRLPHDRQQDWAKAKAEKLVLYIPPKPAKTGVVSASDRLDELLQLACSDPDAVAAAVKAKLTEAFGSIPLDQKAPLNLEISPWTLANETVAKLLEIGYLCQGVEYLIVAARMIETIYESPPNSGTNAAEGAKYFLSRDAERLDKLGKLEPDLAATVKACAEGTKIELAALLKLAGHLARWNGIGAYPGDSTSI